MMFCLRVMVGVIILYDHVHPVGAFAKSSPIDVSSSFQYITLLTQLLPSDRPVLLIMLA